MDNRARASLTYRILTDVLGLTLVLGAFSLSLISYQDNLALVRSVALYVVVFAVLIVIWRRLGSMFDLGILGGRVSGVVGMVIALSVALTPLFLKIVLSTDDAVHTTAANLLAVSFGLIMLLLMFLVRRSHAYKSKAHWRLVHHALLIMGIIFLLSTAVPLSMAPLANIPVKFFIWALALVSIPLVQRLGSGMVANPAQPQRMTPSTSSGSPAGASSAGANAPASSYSSDRERSSEDREDRGGNDPQHRRPPRRGGRGRFHRHSGPSRRRM